MDIVRRTRQSRRDYREIWEYIAQDNEAAANRVIESFDKKVERLADFPEIGRSRDELETGMRSLPCGNYVIFYRPIAGGIQLLRVLHGARDFRTIFGHE